MARNSNSCVTTFYNIDIVMQRQRMKNGFDFMVPIYTLSNNLKM